MHIDIFLNYLRNEKRYSENTVVAYGRDLELFRTDMGLELDSDPSLITSDDIRKWIMHKSAQGLSPASVNRMSSSLRAWFRFLRKQQIVSKDPLAGISSMKKPARLPSFVPRRKMGEYNRQLEDTADFSRTRDRLVIMLLYSTGMRLAELLEVKFSDFSPSMDRLRVTGKGNKERLLPVVEPMRRMLADYLAILDKENICISGDNFLILTEHGTPVSRSGIYRIVQRELKNAGVQGKASPHVLRHTFATHMLNEGADIRDIQELLGHSSLAATQVYTHNSITVLKQAYNDAHPRARNNKK